MQPSWRSVLPVHPAAELFPPMSEDELRALGEDIKKSGLQSPIVLWLSNGSHQLLDGRNRLDAMEAVGLGVVDDGEINVQERLYVEPPTDPVAYVISANIRRRHLTAEQKRELIAKLIKATPEKSDRQIAETVKASPTTVGTVRAEMEAKGDVSKLDTRRDSRGRKQRARKPARSQLSKMLRTDRAEYLDQQDVRGGTAKGFRDYVRKKYAPVGDTAPPARDDVGPASTGELERLRTRNEELENSVRRPELENSALRSEIEELRTELGKSPLASDDPGPMPACLRRAQS